MVGADILRIVREDEVPMVEQEYEVLNRGRRSVGIDLTKSECAELGTNILDGWAHFHDAYETSGGRYVALGSIEPKFYAELIRFGGIEDPDFRNQMDLNKRPELNQKPSRVFKCRRCRE